MAVQVAKHLGASYVAAAGREPDKLAAVGRLGADTLIDIGAPTAAEQLATAGADVDVVIDYLWGAPAARALRVIVPARTDDAQQLTWIEIGSVAGAECPIPSAALRATSLQIIGSGQGSVSPSTIVAELPALAAEISIGTFEVNAHAIPLARVESAWTASARADDRLVLVP